MPAQHSSNSSDCRAEALEFGTPSSRRIDSSERHIMALSDKSNHVSFSGDCNYKQNAANHSIKGVGGRNAPDLTIMNIYYIARQLNFGKIFEYFFKCVEWPKRF